MKYTTGFQNTNLCAISQTGITGVCSFAAQASILYLVIIWYKPPAAINKLSLSCCFL